MQTFLPKMNIGVTVIKPNDLVALSAALDAHKVCVQARTLDLGAFPKSPLPNPSRLLAATTTLR